MQKFLIRNWFVPKLTKSLEWEDLLVNAFEKQRKNRLNNIYL